MQVHILKAFHDNYIWLLEGPAQSAWVVDPGDAAVVEAALSRLGLTLAGILITHHHADHTGGISALCRDRDITVYGPAEPIQGLTEILEGGETLSLPSIGRAQVIAVPGHTSRHIAYYLAQDALLFCGDTLFSAGCGRLFEGTAKEMYMSINSLNALPGPTLICCAHEYTQANLAFAHAVEPANPALQERLKTVNRLRASGLPTVPISLAEERTYNPFLRCREPAVTQAVSAQAQIPLQAGLETFAALRRWKDGFKA